jgi:hypothetical protein
VLLKAKIKRNNKFNLEKTKRITLEPTEAKPSPKVQKHYWAQYLLFFQLCQ